MPAAQLLPPSTEEGPSQGAAHSNALTGKPTMQTGTIGMTPPLVHHQPHLSALQSCSLWLHLSQSEQNEVEEEEDERKHQECQNREKEQATQQMQQPQEYKIDGLQMDTSREIEPIGPLSPSEMESAWKHKIPVAVLPAKTPSPVEPSENTYAPTNAHDQMTHISDATTRSHTGPSPSPLIHPLVQVSFRSLLERH